MAWDPRALVRKTFNRVDQHGPLQGPHSPPPRNNEIKAHLTIAPPARTTLRQAILRTRQWLLGQQHADGYWVGELEGDTILESEYILLLAFLGREYDEVARKCGRHLLKKQMPEGGWAQYPGGAIDVSASVKAYFALKLVGHAPSSEPMNRARAAILAHGGADAVNSFTRFYLALLGQIGYEHCPSVPPEFVLLPKWFPINLYAVSAWSRTIIVPLSIMSAHKPVRHVETGRGIRELFLREPKDWPPLRCPGLKRGTGLLSWDRFFRTVDASLKFLERNRLLPCREKAIRAAARWMIDRFDGSDGLGAIFPPMVWSVIALHTLGHDDNTPQMRYCLERLNGLIIEEEDSARLQPCKSPVWDTAITLRALADSGLPAENDAIQAATDWLLDNEVRFRGDWSKTVKCEPGGWCFEHANQFYPDLDDTAMAVMALNTHFADGIRETIQSLPPPLAMFDEHQHPRWTEPDARVARLDRTLASIARAEKWMLAMQNRDGGWGAFDRDNDRQFLCYVPFADHNAMIDPSTPDLTARVLEALARLGKRVGDAAVDRAVSYLRATQEADGSWFGRWGVNYIYGTWQTLVGLTAVGVANDDPAIVAAANWLIAHQQPNGGWGESADSYAEPYKRGQGPATASQTAWALLGLISTGGANHSAVARGVAWLLDHQKIDGTWHEEEFTGTGFPRVFYLRYHMYPIYFPLMALSQYATHCGVPDSKSVTRCI